MWARWVVVAWCGFVGCGDDRGGAVATCDRGDLECYLDHLVVTENGQPLTLSKIASIPMPVGGGGGGGGTVWVVGDNGLILRWTGQWEVVASGTSAGLTSVAGRSDNDVWAVGYNGTSLHWDGSEWTPGSGLSAGWAYRAVSARAGQPVWTTGTPGDIGSICVVSSATGWVCQTPTNSPSLRGLWQEPTGELWSTGGITTGYLSRRTAGGADISGPIAGAIVGNAVWGTSSTDVWIGGGGLQHWDGNGLTTVTLDTTYAITAITGTAGNDAWLSQDYVGVRHFDGTTWSASMGLIAGVAVRVFGMYAIAANDVWAVGTASTVGATGLIMHWDGTTWTDVTPQPVPTGSLSGVWASGPSAPPPGGGNAPSLTGSLGESLQFSPQQTHTISIPWRDPNACRPAFCFSACSPMGRCFAPARCTKSIADGLMQGTTTLGVRYDAVPIGMSESFDLWITPIVMSDCSDLVQGGAIPDDALIGGADKIGQTVDPAPGHSSGGTCLNGSSRACIDFGANGGCDGCTGNLSTCMPFSEWTSRGFTPPASCKPAGETGCFYHAPDGANNFLIEPCCAGLTCQVGPGCSNGADTGTCL